MKYFIRWLTSPIRQWRLRKAANQVIRGEIPVNYNLVDDLQRQINDDDEGGKNLMADDREEGSLTNGLRIVRFSVAQIRVIGFDQALLDYDLLIAPDDGVKKNPYDAGSGQAKQWVRGYCMGAGIPPKELMRIA